MFLGWYDADKKFPIERKLAEAIARYTEKFGSEPVLALVNPDEAKALEGKTDFPFRAVAFLAHNTFYVGVEDPEPMVALR